MATTTINLAGKRGLAQRFWGDKHRVVSQPNLRYATIDGQMAEGIYNPMMYNGYMAPANNSFLAMDIPTIAGGFTCVGSESGFNQIGFGNIDEHIYTADYVFTETSVDYTFSTLDAAKFEDQGDKGGDIFDIEVYLKNGNKLFYYVNGADVGTIQEDDWDSADATWLTATADGGAALENGTGKSFLRVADNGFMYIFDDHRIHKVDGDTTGGTNGTVVMDILKFPDSLFEIQDALDHRGNFYIPLNFVGYNAIYNNVGDTSIFNAPLCGVYVWDRLSTAVRMRDFIAIKDIKAIVRIWLHTDGVIHLMTVGSNNEVEIRKFNGNQFVVKQVLPQGAKISVHDGLLTAEGMTIWAGDDGYIYAYGKFSPNDPDGVYRIAQYSTATLDTSGGTVLFYSGSSSFAAEDANTTANRPSLYIAYKESGENANIKRWFFYGTGTLTSANGAAGEAYFTAQNFVAHQGNVYTGVTFLPFMSTVKHINIFCAPGTTSSTDVVGTIKIYFNQSTTPILTKSVTAADIKKGYIPIQTGISFVTAIQFEIEWSTSQVLGTNDFLPSYATVEYNKEEESKAPTGE